MRFCSAIKDSVYIIIHLLQWCRFGWVRIKFRRRRSGSRSQQFCHCICSTQDIGPSENWHYSGSRASYCTLLTQDGSVKSSKTIDVM